MLTRPRVSAAPSGSGKRARRLMSAAASKGYPGRVTASLRENPRTRTGSNRIRARSPRLRAARSHTRWIVRALARDGHVVHVALAQARRGDAHKFGLGVEVREILR